VVVERQPVDDLIHRLAVGSEPLAVQPAHFQAAPQAVRGRIVPAVVLLAGLSCPISAISSSATKFVFQGQSQVGPQLRSFRCDVPKRTRSLLLRLRRSVLRLLAVRLTWRYLCRNLRIHILPTLRLNLANLGFDLPQSRFERHVQHLVTFR